MKKTFKNLTKPTRAIFLLECLDQEVLLENILSINQEVFDLGEIEILPDILMNLIPNKEQNPYEEY